MRPSKVAYIVAIALKYLGIVIASILALILVGVLISPYTELFIEITPAILRTFLLGLFLLGYGFGVIIATTLPILFLWYTIEWVTNTINDYRKYSYYEGEDEE